MNATEAVKVGKEIAEKCKADPSIDERLEARWGEGSRAILVVVHGLRSEGVGDESICSWLNMPLTDLAYADELLGELALR